MESKIKWPNIFSEKPNIDKQFIDFCNVQYFQSKFKIGLDRSFPRIKKLTGSCNYAIWHGGPSVLQSAWDNNSQITGPGFVSPDNIQEEERVNFLGSNSQSAWERYKNNDIKNNIKKTINLDGNFIGFHTWWDNNYGHILHDTLPYLSWLISQVDDSYKIILSKSKKKQEIIKEIDIKLFNRIIWVEFGDLVKISGNLVVSIPDVIPTIMGKNFMPYFKNMIKSSSSEKTPRDVIFYTRNGTTDRRVLDDNNEKQSIDLIRRKIKEFQIKGDLIIFSGKDEFNNTLSVRDQIEIFKNAHTVIGPHGTGLVNFVWSNLDKVKILEFIPSVECGIVQRPFNGYHNVFHGLELDYNHILYTDDSNLNQTKIKLTDLEKSLNTIWSK